MEAKLKKASLKDYYQLTKPGIIYGNVLTATGGFLLAAAGHIQLGLLIATLAGSALIIASGCVFNNHLDKGIDKQMKRTQNRALVTGKITSRQALIFGAILGIMGFSILRMFTNTTTVIVGFIGIVTYVVIYGYFKRRSVYSTLVGSVAGAVPIVAGYTAVTAHFDLGALLLFIILATWQMPHFYAIAMYRSEEYRAAKLPVLPLVKGMQVAQRQTMWYIVAFTLACVLLSAKGYAGYCFMIVMIGLGVAWFWRGYRSYHMDDLNKWGRRMFLFSLTVIMGLSVMLAVGSILP